MILGEDGLFCFEVGEFYFYFGRGIVAWQCCAVILREMVHGACMSRLNTGEVIGWVLGRGMNGMLMDHQDVCEC